MAGEEEPAQNLEAYIAAVRVMKDPEHHLTVTRLSYGRLAPQTLYLEPWGATVQMPGPGDYDIVAHAPVADYDRVTYATEADWNPGRWLTIEVMEDYITVYVPTVAEGFAVFHDGVLIWGY